MNKMRLLSSLFAGVGAALVVRPTGYGVTEANWWCFTVGIILLVHATATLSRKGD